MKKLLCLLFILPFVAFGGGCSSDDSPTDGGTPDTTPPGIASVTALNQNQLQIVFTEQVTKASAERSEHYTIVELSPPPVSPAMAASPGDTVHVGSASLGGDGKTVTVSTWDGMGTNPYEVTVSGVSDPSGNVISDPVAQTFTGSNASDTTPPTIIMRSPGPGATNVGIGESVQVQFSELMDYGSVVSALQWTWDVGIVSWEPDQNDGNVFVFTPTSPLANNQTYVVSVTGTATDLAGNPLANAPVNWTFTTTGTVDNTPPRLTSSTPANGAANVAVNTNLVLTFSEAVNQEIDVLITPDIGDGVPVWSNGGRTVTYDPFDDMLDDQQYTLVILPDGIRDLAGNANTEIFQVVWSTGSAFENGGFRGTISGDSQSPPASNPAGALIIAATENPFAANDDFGIGGSSVVGSNGTYAITNLADGWYFPLCAMDSNNDGTVDPSMGDAVGLYGVNFTDDFEADSVGIAQGQTITGVNFGLYDPIAVTGTVSYGGSGGFPYAVGMFDTTGLDLNNLPEPDYGEDDWWPSNADFQLDELDYGIMPGTYFVGAYLDVNFSGQYEPDIDPAGFYGGLIPTPVTLTHGQDALGLEITMMDPDMVTTAPPVSWTRKASAVDPRLQDVMRRVRGVFEANRQ